MRVQAQSDNFVGSATSGIYHFVSAMRTVLYHKPLATSVDAAHKDYVDLVRQWWGHGFGNITAHGDNATDGQ